MNFTSSGIHFNDLTPLESSCQVEKCSFCKIPVKDAYDVRRGKVHSSLIFAAEIFLKLSASLVFLPQNKLKTARNEARRQ
jgi:hypothetical protein